MISLAKKEGTDMPMRSEALPIPSDAKGVPSKSDVSVIPTAAPNRSALSMTPHVPLTDLSVLPTLFPTPIANLITALATSARLSLRVTAFFIEAILETSQYSTRMSLGYSRRLLVSAMSSARRMYHISNAAFEGDLLGVMGITEPGPGSTDKFLQVLDKYTNLGIYVIHHTFTMAELFAMSGFYLTANAVQSAHFAAQESVTLFDSLFGSNESSRALSSIITLVRRELLEDERFKAADKGKITSLTALTKALTAFACLQTATWKRASERLHMKILYDCTVVAERDESYSSSSTVSVRNAVTVPTPRPGEETKAVAGSRPSTLTSRQQRASAPASDSRDRLSVAESAAPSARPLAPSPQQSISMDLDDLWELENLVGEFDQEEYEGAPNECVRRQRRLKRMREDMLEITDVLSESTTITHLLERVNTDGTRFSTSAQLRESNTPMPDVSVEDLDEEPEVHVSTIRNLRRQSESSLPSAEDENDWIEVDDTLDGSGLGSIPSVPNGHNSIGTESYRDALEHPHANADRIQLVLRTMTNKLLQRRRTVRRVRPESLSEQSSPEGSRQRGVIPTSASCHPDVRAIDWSQSESHASYANRLDPDAESQVSFKTSISTSISTSRNPTPTGKRRIFRPKPSVPPSANDRHTATRVPPMNKVVSKARTAFSSSRSSRSSSPQPAPIPDAVLTSTSNGIVPPPPTPSRSALTLSPESTQSGYPAPTSPRRDSFRPATPFTTVHESIHMSESRVQAATTHVIPDSTDSNEDSSGMLFPPDSLVRNIHRFMRYSSAAYGQNFLRILGLGNADYNFPSTARHHANSWAFAQHTNIPIDCLLLSSYTEATPTFGSQKAAPLVHYIAVQHDIKAIVLTCRGTLGLSDVLVDLTCDYRTIQIDGGDPDAEYYVHSGMYQSALGLTARDSTVHKTLVDALNRYPNYGLVVAGHSLGGGVTALLAIAYSTPADVFLRQADLGQSLTYPPISTPFVTSVASGLPPGRPIHCYAYGPPAVVSPDLTRYSRGLITSVVQNSDVVPCLSLGVLRDLKNIAVTLFEEGNVAEEIVGRVIGINQRKFTFQQNAAQFGDNGPFNVFAEQPTDEEVLNDWMMSLIKTMRADMDNAKLYPPGMVYIMEYFDIFVTSEPEEQPRQGKTVSHKQAHRVILRRCDSVEERFREPLFTKTMLNDHLPSQYERSTQLLVEGARQGKV